MAERMPQIIYQCTTKVSYPFVQHRMGIIKRELECTFNLVIYRSRATLVISRNPFKQVINANYRKNFLFLCTTIYNHCSIIAFEEQQNTKKVNKKKKKTKKSSRVLSYTLLFPAVTVVDIYLSIKTRAKRTWIQE